MAVATMTGDLRISLLATKAAAGLARTLAETRLGKWGFTDISGDALLVIAELVTNSVQETPNREIQFRLARDGAGVLIAVWDSSPRPPVARPVTELTLDTLDVREEHWDDNGGWGLALVQALSADCGCDPDPTGGKWVWARIKP
jgi:anti-sigma regulatory factor (Ser/Thr protein kinase)